MFKTINININNNVNLLTNIVFKANKRIKYLQYVKSIYFVSHKKVYFFNHVNILPYCFYEFFNKSCFYFLNHSLNRSTFNVKSVYIKFLKFYFRKFRFRKFFNLRRF